MLFLTDLQKRRLSIRWNLFLMYVKRLFEKPYIGYTSTSQVVPLVTMSKSDDGVLENSTELFKFYRHTYKDASIFCKDPCVCFRNSQFHNLKLMMKTIDDLSSYTTFTVIVPRKNIVKTFRKK